MYCTKCGTRNDDSAITCIQCGTPFRPPDPGTPATPAPPQAVPPTPQYQAPVAQAYYQQPGLPPSIPNYLVQAILVTIFCCLPLGIVSIVFAAQVNGKAAAGDIAGAMAASKQAKTFAWIAFGIGAGGALIWMMLGILGTLGRLATHVH